MAETSLPSIWKIRKQRQGAARLRDKTLIESLQKEVLELKLRIDTVQRQAWDSYEDMIPTCDPGQTPEKPESSAPSSNQVPAASFKQIGSSTDNIEV